MNLMHDGTAVCGGDVAHSVLQESPSRDSSRPCRHISRHVNERTCSWANVPICFMQQRDQDDSPDTRAAVLGALPGRLVSSLHAGAVTQCICRCVDVQTLRWVCDTYTADNRRAWKECNCKYVAFMGALTQPQAGEGGRWGALLRADLRLSIAGLLNGLRRTCVYRGGLWRLQQSRPGPQKPAGLHAIAASHVSTPAAASVVGEGARAPRRIAGAAEAWEAGELGSLDIPRWAAVQESGRSAVACAAEEAGGARGSSTSALSTAALSTAALELRASASELAMERGPGG